MDKTVFIAGRQGGKGSRMVSELLQGLAERDKRIADQQKQIDAHIAAAAGLTTASEELRRRYDARIAELEAKLQEADKETQAKVFQGAVQEQRMKVTGRDKLIAELATLARKLEANRIEWKESSLSKDARIADLEHAVRTMLAAVADAPEQFPGQNATYLQTVAIPRAQKALAGEPE